MFEDVTIAIAEGGALGTVLFMLRLLVDELEYPDGLTAIVYKGRYKHAFRRDSGESVHCREEFGVFLDVHQIEQGLGLVDHGLDRVLFTVRLRHHHVLVGDDFEANVCASDLWPLVAKLHRK